MLVPLQQGFDSDSEACLPVTIDHLITFFASEQRIVGIMSFPDSTAVGTPFRCMPAINYVQSNIIIEASLFEDASENVKRDSHSFPVEILPLSIESFELFDSNVRIESFGNPDYFGDHLTEIGLDKIPLGSPERFQLLSGLQGLKNSPSFHDFLTPCPNVLTEIGLKQNLSIWSNNADSEMLGVDINAEDILMLGNLLIFGQISDNLSVTNQSVSLAIPSISNQRTVSLPVTVLLDGNSEPLPRIYSQFNKKIGLRAESLAVTGNVEFDSNSIDILSFAFPDVPFQIANHLTIKWGVHLAS
jgi:hypothetical protein